MALAVATAVLSVAIELKKPLTLLLSGNAEDLHVLYISSIYNRTVVAINYFDDGFVRRGLAGTIIRIAQLDWLPSVVFLIAVSAVFLAVPIAWLILNARHRIGSVGLLILAAMPIVSPQLFRSWALDFARTDMLAAGTICWMVLAMVHRFTKAAVIFLLIGLLIHETALIFGVPLFLILLARRVQSQDIGATEGALAIGSLGIGCVAIWLAEAHWSASSSVISAHMLDAGPDTTEPAAVILTEIATYMMVAGGRGLHTAMCFNFGIQPRFPVDAAMAIFIAISYYWIIPIRLKLFEYCLAVIVPLATMLAIANDTGRWVCLAVFNAWLLTVMTANTTNLVIRSYRLLFGVILLFAMNVMGAAYVFRVNDFTPKIAEKLHLAQVPGPEDLMNRCDPAWRTVLQQ